jgi:NADPH:quinone reductase-like Zn-dependent oxidoreductase
MARSVVVTKGEDFEQAVLAFTNGRGVDLAIDSLGATMLDRTFNVVCKLGHIIRIGEAEGQPLKTFGNASCRVRRLLRAFISAMSTQTHKPGKMACPTSCAASSTAG